MGAKTCVKIIFTAQMKQEILEEVIRSVRTEAEKQPGFLGMESGSDNGVETTVSYWKSAEDVRLWAGNDSHKAAQARWEEYYHWYRVEWEEDTRLDSELASRS